MFGRIFLSIATLVSIVWLGFATYNRVNLGKQFQPEYVFNDLDSSVLVIQNYTKLEQVLPLFDVQSSEMKDLLGAINPQFVDKLYISQKRGHAILITKKEVNAQTINDLFNGQLKPEFTPKSLKIGGLIGEISRNKIYFYSQQMSKKATHWEEAQFDANADAAILTFTHQQPTVTDVYIKKSGIVEYKSSFNNQLIGKKVNDKVVFAPAISSAITSYEFFETNYLHYLDPNLKNSPLANWLKYGIVKVKINGQEAFISDYIDGQEPIQVLYDHFRREPVAEENAYFKGLQLTKLMQQNDFYIYQMDDYVVFSASRAACETLISDYKLGSTLSQSSNRLSEIYSQLPQKVNYRKINGSEKESISIYNNVLLTTVVGASSKEEQKEVVQETTQPASYVIGGVTNDILFVDANNFFAITNNKVVYFENNQKKWEKQGDAIIGQANLVVANGKTQLLVATAKKIHLYEVTGNEPAGFPISLNNETVVQTPLLFQWKGTNQFIIPVAGGKLLQFDQQGREIAVIKTQVGEIIAQPLGWISAKKPFIGVKSATKFEMIQFDNRRSYRSFALENSEISLLINNEIKLIGIDNNQLTSYDQKGGVTRFEKFTSAQLIPTIDPMKGIVVKDKQLIRLFNTSGTQWGSIQLPFNDLSDIQVFETNNGSTILCGIDGLENKVYCWKSTGEKYTNETFEGSKIVRYKNGYLFTVIDNLVVKYPLK